MVDAVLQEAIKNIFGSSWLIPAFIILLLFAFFNFVFKSKLPQYFKTDITIAMSFISAYLLSKFFNWDKLPNIQPFVEGGQWGVLAIAGITFIFLFCSYHKIDKQLDDVLENAEPCGDKIAAWKELQSIKVSRLAHWQKKKYDKYRLYLRVFLGNMRGAEQELEKYQDDKPFYHYMRAVILNFKRSLVDELAEVKLAEDYCDGETLPLLHFQIIANRGVAYVGVGEYALANDCFEKAIEFGEVNGIKDTSLWLNIYANYTFNKTRLDTNISLEKCFDILEGVKRHIDIEEPKQYLGLSNIVVELLRQKNAGREKLDETINQVFEYIVNTNLTEVERCVFEASTARMVCTGRLSPEAVIERLSKDLELFLKLPMPDKYRCFKEIDYMFRDLMGPIVDRSLQLKETAHWYIVNQAIADIDGYRASLPSEAVYEICYCFKERAGLLKNKPDQYKWEEFLKNIQSVQLLYKENELLAESALCYLDVMDEATAEINMNSELRPVHMDKMQECLAEIEKILPHFKEHPILNEIYLRLAIYCFVMDDIEKSKEYYSRFRKLGEFSINHFAPWLRGKYSIISLAMLVVGYVETVDKIAKQDLSKEIPQIRDWFKYFHDRNGYFEAVVFGRILGSEIIPLYLESVPGATFQGDCVAIDDVKEAWLVIPALFSKIKCNGSLSKVKDDDGLLSDFTDGTISYCNVNLLMPEMQHAIERIAEMIIAEMPDYLISSEELNRLAEDSWYNVVIG